MVLVTINATLFTDWARKPEAELARFNRASPALVSLRNGLIEAFPGVASLGIYGVRDQRGGSLRSAHSFGAALDLSYRGAGRAKADSIVEYVLWLSDELDVQAIHDYQRATIWRSVRGAPGTGGWRPQTPSPRTGMGQAWADWLHFEVTEQGWADGRPMREKTTTTRPAVTIGSNGPHVAAAQAILAERASQDVGPIDGWFGPRTAAGWRNVQAFCQWPTVDDDVIGDDWNLLAWIDQGWGRLNAAGVV
jgi:hypothetical protein